MIMKILSLSVICNEIVYTVCLLWILLLGILLPPQTYCIIKHINACNTV